MNRALGKILTVFLLVLTCGILAGCSDTGEISRYGSEVNGQGGSSAEETFSQDDNGSTKGANGQGGEKGEILLVERRTNFAWGYHDSGVFVDTEGKLYGYDFSRYPAYMAYDENALTFIERLEVIREHSDGVDFFDEEFIQNMIELGEMVSAKDEFNEEEKMYDYGQDTLYFYQPKTQELLRVKSVGDVDYTPKNKNAKKIAQKYENYMKKHEKKISELGIFFNNPTVYSTGDVTMMNFTAEDVSMWVGKWVIETKAQLKTFVKQSAIPVEDVLTDKEDNEYDESTYFIFVEPAGQTENGGNPRAIWVQGNCIDFVSPDGMCAEEGTYVCHIAKVRKEDLPGDVTGILDLDGNAWKIP